MIARIGDQPDVRQLGPAIDEDHVGGLHIAVDQAVPVQVAERFGQRQADLQHARSGQPALRQIGAQCVRDIGFQVHEVRKSGSAPCCAIPPFLRSSELPSGLLHSDIVRQLHHVVEISRRIVAPDVEERQLAGMLARDPFEPLDALELALEWPVILRRCAARRSSPRGHSGGVAAGQPDLAIRASAHAPQQVVIGHPRPLRSL